MGVGITAATAYNMNAAVTVTNCTMQTTGSMNLCPDERCLHVQPGRPTGRAAPVTEHDEINKQQYQYRYTPQTVKAKLQELECSSV